MSEKIAVDLGNVQKTLFLPLWDGPSKLPSDSRLRVIERSLFFRAKGQSLSLKNRIFGFISDSLMIQYMLHLGILPRPSGA